MKKGLFFVIAMFSIAVSLHARAALYDSSTEHPPSVRQCMMTMQERVSELSMNMLREMHGMHHGLEDLLSLPFFQGSLAARTMVIAGDRALVALRDVLCDKLCSAEVDLLYATGKVVDIHQKVSDGNWRSAREELEVDQSIFLMSKRFITWYKRFTTALSHLLLKANRLQQRFEEFTPKQREFFADAHKSLFEAKNIVDSEYEKILLCISTSCLESDDVDQDRMWLESGHTMGVKQLDGLRHAFVQFFTACLPGFAFVKASVWGLQNVAGISPTLYKDAKLLESCLVDLEALIRSEQQRVLKNLAIVNRHENIESSPIVSGRSLHDALQQLELVHKNCGNLYHCVASGIAALKRGFDRVKAEAKHIPEVYERLVQMQDEFADFAESVEKAFSSIGDVISHMHAALGGVQKSQVTRDKRSVDGVIEHVEAVRYNACYELREVGGRIQDILDVNPHASTLRQASRNLLFIRTSLDDAIRALVAELGQAKNQLL